MRAAPRLVARPPQVGYDARDRAPMLPFILSPYLRPILRHGQLCLDDYRTGHVTPLSPLMALCTRALWTRDPARARRDLEQLARDHGTAPVFAALDQLRAADLIFPDAAHAEAALAAHLLRQLPLVPFVDQIELTNRCPMRCGFCPRGVPGRLQRPTGLMDLGLFQQLLPQLHPGQARYRPLELHHLGESLLHPQVAEFVAAASARGLPTEMSMNPALLSKELSRRLLGAGLRRLVISLDGMDDATLIALRGPAAPYRKSAHNLDALLEQVAARPDPPTVVIQMIDLHRNRHQREAFLQRWGTTGLPTVHAYIKDLDGPDPDTGRGSATPQDHLCTYPFRSVVILWDGRVVPCCRDDDAHLVLGDLRHTPLAEIWRGPAATALRARHASGQLPEGHLCAGCGWLPARFAAALEERHPDQARPQPLAW